MGYKTQHPKTGHTALCRVLAVYPRDQRPHGPATVRCPAMKRLSQAPDHFLEWNVRFFSTLLVTGKFWRIQFNGQSVNGGAASEGTDVFWTINSWKEKQEIIMPVCCWCVSLFWQTGKRVVGLCNLPSMEDHTSQLPHSQVYPGTPSCPIQRGHFIPMWLLGSVDFQTSWLFLSRSYT